MGKQIRQVRSEKKGIDVLEVGSGNGQWLIAFSKFANRVEGIEPVKEILEYSLQKFEEYGVQDKVKVTQASSEKLPQKDQSFDLIFCAGVFMFTNQKETLKEFKRVLRDNGKVLIIVNGLGYSIMRLSQGMAYLSLKKTKSGMVVILNTIFQWIFNKQIGTSVVSYNYMNKILNEAGLEIQETRIWLDQEKYPFEHFGFVTSYAFLIKKKINLTKKINWYFSPSLINGILGIISIYIMTSYLTVQQFGQIELFLLILLALKYLFSFGWDSSLIRFYNDQKEKKYDILLSTFILRIIIHTSVIILFYFFSDNFLDLVKIDLNYLDLFWVVLIIYIIDDYLNLFNLLFRSENLAQSYGILNISQHILTFILLILFLILFNLEIYAVFYSFVIAKLIVLFFVFLKYQKYFFQKKIRILFKY